MTSWHCFCTSRDSNRSRDSITHGGSNNNYTVSQNVTLFTRESSYCFQRVLAIAILSVCLSVCPSVRPSVHHTGRSVKNGEK